MFYAQSTITVISEREKQNKKRNKQTKTRTKITTTPIRQREQTKTEQEQKQATTPQKKERKKTGLSTLWCFHVLLAVHLFREDSDSMRLIGASLVERRAEIRAPSMA